jgi:DNA-binding response OmpR family regulator
MVKGLRSGADDVMAKPVGDQEILARIETLLRRKGKEQRSSVLADDFIRIDRHAHRVEALGVEVDLTPIEFRMLAVFADHPARP